MLSFESSAAPAILALFERPAAQHAKVVKRFSLDYRGGFGLGSLPGWPPPQTVRRYLLSLPVEQTLTLFLSPIGQLGPRYLAKARFSFSREKGGMYFSVSGSLKLNSRG